ncbi:hypothetical protein [Pelagibacterium limicola]|uniref:hypothetical protein n=1 Tax=Pelagibacterium limicola TaxID=2791022 RepID=UPI001A9AEBE9|nr:hypothetical protein [Pelagibacterium limicola]
MVFPGNKEDTKANDTGHPSFHGFGTSERRAGPGAAFVSAKPPGDYVLLAGGGKAC